MMLLLFFCADVETLYRLNAMRIQSWRHSLSYETSKNACYIVVTSTFWITDCDLSTDTFTLDPIQVSNMCRVFE